MILMEKKEWLGMELCRENHPILIYNAWNLYKNILDGKTHNIYF
ncbi:hypothetical protein LCGC14_0982840 [marine sediment metagenome]|uniref:Uncharacterized protein n=1 Tax=marine sediment metagenome TaxID=412755 RepID=A0A0F9QRF3_9ZZZZ